MRIKVLIVDSHKENVALLKRKVCEFGHEAVETDNFKNALKICRKWRPALLISASLVKRSHPWKFFFKVMGMGLPSRPYLLVYNANPTIALIKTEMEEPAGDDEYRKSPVELTELLRWLKKAKDITTWSLR